MTQWFGKSWGAPICDPNDHVPTPAWTRCARCREHIVDGDQGVVSLLVTETGWEPIAHHLDCFLKGILPHGPECPHCRGVEPRDHSPSCSMKTTGLCDCRPMPAGVEGTVRWWCVRSRLMSNRSIPRAWATPAM